jgi:hypothetical protein
MAKRAEAVPFETEKRPVELTLPALVSDGGLWFRQEIADGSLEHEGEKYEVEVAASVGGGAVLVTIQRPEKNRAKGETWSVYAFSPDALIRACMTDYLDQRKREKESATPKRTLRRRADRKASEK